MAEVVKTNIKGVVLPISSLEELNALFEKIKKTEPERYARLEAVGEYENQIKVLGLAKPEAVKTEPKETTKTESKAIVKNK